MDGYRDPPAHRPCDAEYPAREQVDQAEALFRDMGMDWWTEQAEGLRGRIERVEQFVWFAPYVDGPPDVA